MCMLVILLLLKDFIKFLCIHRVIGVSSKLLLDQVGNAVIEIQFFFLIFCPNESMAEERLPTGSTCN